jgi:LacI family transcriptional regulator
MSERSEKAVSGRNGNRVTLEQVAKATGLGRTTISDILNRNAGSKYSVETRELVEKAVAELGYSPARAAQQLARGRSGMIGLMLMRDLSNPFFARVADLVEREIRKRGYRLQMTITDGDHEHELERIRQMHSDAVEGLIVGPVYESLDMEQHRNVFRGGLPIVVFGGPFECEFDQVTLDHSGGWSMRVKHLAEQGHRRVGVLALPPSRLSPDHPNLRHEGLKMLSRAGILELEWVFWQADTGHFQDFYATATRFARAWKNAEPGKRPTAMVCHNDQVAMTAISALAGAGIRVPEDVSLIGYDNLPESAYFVPPLTTVDPNVVEQMGASVELLLDRIKNPNRERVVKVISAELVCRESIKRLPTDTRRRK